jgi:DNA-binding response OmpR family regulator
MKTENKQPAEVSVLKTDVSNVAANVLIIDDDADVAYSIATCLKAEGYGVHTVESRDKALLVLDSYLYDFIIMDLFMTGLPANEFIAAVRNQFRSKIILISGAQHVAQQAQRLAVPLWLGKPFEPEQLLHMLKQFNH